MSVKASIGSIGTLLVGLGVALMPGCKDDDGSIEQANSNTSWLTTCVEDAECGSAFSCLCGVCTRPCSDQDCDDLGGSCAAIDSSAHTLQCGGGDRVPVCLRACSAEHSECDAEQACADGGCAARPETDPCAGADGTLVCSSFEEPDTGVTEVVLEGGEIGLSMEQSLFGTSALAASVAAGSERSVLHYEFEPQMTGALYLRAWLYLDVEATSALHFHALTVGSVDTATWGTTLHVLDGKLGFSFSERGDVEGTASVPARRWFCVRAEIALGADDGSASAFVDDAMSLEVSAVDTLPPEGAHNVAAGIDYTTEPDLRLFVDALRLSTSPVGCTE